MINGVWCEDPRVIKTEVFNFYTDTFKENSLFRPILSSNRYKTISQAHKEDLEMVFGEEEVWNAIKGCGSSKALGQTDLTLDLLRSVGSLLKLIF